MLMKMGFCQWAAGSYSSCYTEEAHKCRMLGCPEYKIYTLPCSSKSDRLLLLLCCKELTVPEAVCSIFFISIHQMTHFTLQHTENSFDEKSEYTQQKCSQVSQRQQSAFIFTPCALSIVTYKQMGQQGPVAGCCECGNEPSGFMKGGEFLD